LKKAASILILVVALGVSLTFLESGSTKEKINGVNFEAPRKKISSDAIESVKLVNADWISVIPYAFIDPENAVVKYNYDHHWWGEGVVGATETIKMAKDLGLKVMLKPHVWVRSQGWAGDFKPESEMLWKNWEDSYKSYILEYAKIAEEHNVELLCIGTEFRKAVVERPQFWNDLIENIKNIYSGKLTYAANWDNYTNVGFWSQMDYIGIDSYFPVSDDKTPHVDVLQNKMKPLVKELKSFSLLQKKPILFTEYGYKSIDYATTGHWKYDADTLSVNMLAQANSYLAFYKSFWKERWCAGGFLWKWHARHEKYGGPDCKRYTPQNKPAQNIIASQYYK